MIARALIYLIIATLLVASVSAAEPPAKAVQHYERGLALKRAGNLKKALPELKKAIELHHDYMLAHYALAWVYRHLGMNRKSIDEFREVIRLRPESPQAIESARAIQRIRAKTTVAPARAPNRIVFASTRNANTDLYMMQLDSGRLTRLTRNPAVDDNPTWAPDGRTIAFVSDRDGNRELYAMNLDGTRVRRITYNDAADDYPVWSPDGRFIAFESNRAGNFDVYLIQPDGQDLRRITRSPADDWMGDWSPDGSQLAILSARGGPNKIYLLNADGSFPSRLVDNPVPEGRPLWGPDGAFIYFTWGFQHNAQVCRARIYGDGLTNVTRSPYSDYLCDVSNDGRHLLITSDRDGDDELYLLMLDTGETRRLTTNPGADAHGRFDGSK